MFRISLSAAAFGVAMAMAGFAVGPASARPHQTFCKGGSPTPKHVCDALKAHEEAKPQRATSRGVKLQAVKKAQAPQRTR